MHRMIMKRKKQKKKYKKSNKLLKCLKKTLKKGNKKKQKRRMQYGGNIFKKLFDKDMKNLIKKSTLNVINTVSSKYGINPEINSIQE